MRELLTSTMQDFSSLEIGVIILNNLVSIVFAVFLMFNYKITYSGTAYSRKFNITLGMLTIITTLIMSVISGNVALSLGMVGALSIIRFRTAVKDVRDAGYIFWCIAIGICCGVSQYILAAVSSVFIFFFMLALKQVVPDKKQLLIVRCAYDYQNRIEACILQHFGSAARRRMKNATTEDCEMIYELNESVLKRADMAARVDIVQRLIKMEGTINVNLVDQTDDISR